MKTCQGLLDDIPLREDIQTRPYHLFFRFEWDANHKFADDDNELYWGHGLEAEDFRPEPNSLLVPSPPFHTSRFKGKRDTNGDLCGFN